MNYQGTFGSNKGYTLSDLLDRWVVNRPYSNFDGEDDFFDEELERIRDELEEIDFESIVVKHSSPHAGVDDFTQMSAEEHKLMRYNINHRDLRNVRLWRGQSMNRRKWKHKLGSRRNRLEHRNRHGEKIDNQIYFACRLLEEDRAMRESRMYELRTAESDAVVCGYDDRDDYYAEMNSYAAMMEFCEELHR